MATSGSLADMANIVQLVDGKGEPMVGIARLMKPSKEVQLDGTLMRKLCPEKQVRWPPSCLFLSKGGSKDAL